MPKAFLGNFKGIQGPKGDTGAQGVQGVKGATGTQGVQGLKGDTGAQGPQGPKGDTGSAGPQGVKGATGATGTQGLQGTAGPQGPQGPQGPAGEAATAIATTTVPGIVKASNDIPVDSTGTTKINTKFATKTSLTNIVSDERLIDMLGKFAAWFPKIENALQKSDLVSVQTDDTNKAVSAALAYDMQTQIDQQNSDLDNLLSNELDFANKIALILAKEYTFPEAGKLFIAALPNHEGGGGVMIVRPDAINVSHQHAYNVWISMEVSLNQNERFTITGVNIWKFEAYFVPYKK